MLLLLLAKTSSAVESVYSLTTTGFESLKRGQELFGSGEFESASVYFWRAVLMQQQHAADYTLEEAFSGFIQCYAVQGRTADGYLYIAKESMQRGQKELAFQYLEQALALEPDHEEALRLKDRFSGAGAGSDTPQPKKERTNKFQPQFGTPEADAPLDGKSPEDLYEYGSTLFSRRNYEHCADVFELSCKRSNYQLGPSCSNAIYCRMMVLDWGFNGTGFDADMAQLQKLIERETEQWRRGDLGDFEWQRATSVHPHMMLGYPLPPMLKRYVAESVAYMDETMARIDQNGGGIKPLPDDLPFDPWSEVSRYASEAAQPDFKLKVGFVSSGFNSKAVLYLSQDIFRFYDRSKIEMHIFSCGPADNEAFIEKGMRGVDWRKRVAANVDFFHDVEKLKSDHIKLARFIHDQGIHILNEWDGYARQGERAQGLMALRPAPIQILHQEYLGTSGAKYVDYIFTDNRTSPPYLSDLYVEKLIYLPNHFFSKGHAVQNEVVPPAFEYEKAERPYKIGTGSPEENRCMAKSGSKPKFVFCNFNKFLKNNPETVRSWIRILREVPDSILCILENPETGTKYLKRFIHEAAGTPKVSVDPQTGKEVPDFKPEDGDALVDRIHFLPWERNPFDHQRRNRDFCNIMLDSYPYNGHTVAQDALYAGVPIITRSDGDDMSSRVTTSANIVLGLEELNAYDGPRQYEDIAIEIGNNRRKFDDIRKRLIDTALQRNPMHPYWDAPRYAKNLESGWSEAWDRFLAEREPEDITVVESEEAAQGTYDEVLINNPSDRTSIHDEL